jgi:DNA repair protein RecO (recombination protein O)
MSLYRDEGVVLRTHKLGEADRIVTLLTRRTGRIRAVAKGVRRTTSKFGARLEPFSRVDCQFYAGRNLDIVTQAVSLDAYGASIGNDYARYTAGTAMLETAERLTPEEREPSLRLYLLLVGGLAALTDGVHAPTAVLDSFVLRAMTVAGWAPAIGECARCGAPGPHRWFAPAAGSLCSNCRVTGAGTVSADGVELLDALATGDWDYVDTADPRVANECSGLVAAYLQWHLERGLRSLPLVDRSARA